MTLYFLDGGSIPQPLDGVLRSWRSHSPYWHLRQIANEPSDPGTLPWLFPEVPTYRRAEVREVAEALVADPKVEAALKVIDSPIASHIEFAVASQFLPPADAQLLTEALRLALKYVTDPTKPLWKRADVLVGVGVTLLIVIVVVVATRHAKGGEGPRA